MKFYINRTQFIKETDKEIDGNNFLVAYDVPIAKTGIQQYTREEVGDRDGDPQELVNVYRDHSVFLDEKLLETFNGIPVVYRHPDNGRVDNNNFKDFVVGSVSGVYFKNGDLFAKKITIIDKEAIVNVLNKETNELSIGFRGVVKKSPGKFEGISYLYKEDVLHANHLALCENGKAGPRYAINSKKEKKNMARYSKNSRHEGMEEDCMDSGDAPHPEVGGLVKQAVRKKMKSVHPKNYGDEHHEHHHEHEHEHEHHMEDSEEEHEPEHAKKKERKAFKHLEKEHAMDEVNDEAEDELEESEHKDKDVINALKRTNRKLKDMINSKNNEIRKLELQNAMLEETVLESRDYIKNMSMKLKSRNLGNAMTGPDNIASPTSPRQADMCNSMTASFLYSTLK